jgi:hypothetical protein
LANVAQPFPDTGLIGQLLHPQERLEGFVLVEPLGVGQRDAPAGETMEQLRHVHQERVAFAPVRARVQGRLALEALGQAKLCEQGGHSQPAATHTGLAGVAEFEEKLAGIERDEFGRAGQAAPTGILFTLRVTPSALSVRIQVDAPLASPARDF